MADKSMAENLAQNCEDCAVLIRTPLYTAVFNSAAAELRRLAEIERLYDDMKFRMDGLEK